MDEQMIEPCPFCGSERITWCDTTPAGQQWFSCDDCACEGPPKLTKVRAVSAWNTRAAHSVIAGKVAELTEVLESISNGEAFRAQRFAEDDDSEYFLRAQRHVQQLARAALAPYPERRSE